jgi:hypothetical protein
MLFAFGLLAAATADAGVRPAMGVLDSTQRHLDRV